MHLSRKSEIIPLSRSDFGQPNLQRLPKREVTCRNTNWHDPSLLFEGNERLPRKERF